MKYFFFIINFFLMISSCDQAKDKNKEVGASRDSTVQTELPSQLITIADTSVAGAYKGIFPCKDCEGIQQTILLDMNHTYAQEQTRWEKNGQSIRSTGGWRINGNNLELFDNKNVIAIFEITGDSLLGINIQNIPLQDSLKYVLVKNEFAGNGAVWKQKKADGIKFTGIGNEPFWNLEITKSRINFRLMDWEKPISAYIGDMEQNDMATTYFLVSGKNEWTVKILPFLCSDGMSDLVYKYKVEVEYDGTIYSGCGIEL